MLGLAADSRRYIHLRPVGADIEKMIYRCTVLGLAADSRRYGGKMMLGI